jgi:hypothetical protein
MRVEVVVSRDNTSSYKHLKQKILDEMTIVVVLLNSKYVFLLL